MNRPEVIIGNTRKLKTGCGNIYITVNYYNDKIYELFIRIGKAGGCAASQCEAIGRLASQAIKDGSKVEDIIKQLTGISCHSSDTTNGILSCADALAVVLKKELEKNG